jgi:hypothetical protein
MHCEKLIHFSRLSRCRTSAANLRMRLLHSVLLLQRRSKYERNTTPRAAAQPSRRSRTRARLAMSDRERSTNADIKRRRTLSPTFDYDRLFASRCSGLFVITVFVRRCVVVLLVYAFWIRSQRSAGPPRHYP